MSLALRYSTRHVFTLIAHPAAAFAARGTRATFAKTGIVSPIVSLAAPRGVSAIHQRNMEVTTASSF
jgi:hypothetical protein